MYTQGEASGDQPHRQHVLAAIRVDPDSWVSRTDGASPAFLEELIRRAILFAVERPRVSASGSPIPAADRFEPAEITEQDLSAAMTEILTSGGRLTQRLLGYRTEESV